MCIVVICILKKIGAELKRYVFKSRECFNVFKKRIGYNLNIMRQSACLDINPITGDGFAALFICIPVDRLSESIMAQI